MLTNIVTNHKTPKSQMISNSIALDVHRFYILKGDYYASSSYLE